MFVGVWLSVCVCMWHVAGCVCGMWHMAGCRRLRVCGVGHLAVCVGHVAGLGVFVRGACVARCVACRTWLGVWQGT